MQSGYSCARVVFDFDNGPIKRDAVAIERDQLRIVEERRRRKQNTSNLRVLLTLVRFCSPPSILRGAGDQFLQAPDIIVQTILFPCVTGFHVLISHEPTET